MIALQVVDTLFVALGDSAARSRPPSAGFSFIALGDKRSAHRPPVPGLSLLSFLAKPIHFVTDYGRGAAVHTLRCMLAMGCDLV